MIYIFECLTKKKNNKNTFCSSNIMKMYKKRKCVFIIYNKIKIDFLHHSLWSWTYLVSSGDRRRRVSRWIGDRRWVSDRWWVGDRRWVGDRWWGFVFHPVLARLTLSSDRIQNCGLKVEKFFLSATYSNLNVRAPSVIFSPTILFLLLKK